MPNNEQFVCFVRGGVGFFEKKFEKTCIKKKIIYNFA